MLPWKMEAIPFSSAPAGENENEVPEELVKFLKYVKAGLKESSEDFQDSL